jgi:hypothetical protein
MDGDLKGARDLRHCQVASHVAWMRLTVLWKQPVLQADAFHRVGPHMVAGRGTMARHWQPFGPLFITISVGKEIDEHALQRGSRRPCGQSADAARHPQRRRLAATPHEADVGLRAPDPVPGDRVDETPAQRLPLRWRQEGRLPEVRQPCTEL